MDKIHYIKKKKFLNFSLCHLTWMKLLPGDHTFSMPSLTKGASKFHLKFSSKFSSVTLKVGKRLLSHQSHVIFHIKYPVYLWFLSPLTSLTLKMLQFSSVAQSCLNLCNPMNHSTPGLPVHHQLLEFTQTHVHRVSDAIQPSHPRSSPSPPAPNPSQHQGLFQRVNSSHEVAKVLEFQL